MRRGHALGRVALSFHAAQERGKNHIAHSTAISIGESVLRHSDNGASMRVCQTSPVALNASTT